MGYTHYFQQQRRITNEEWAGVTEDARAIIRATNAMHIPLAQEYDEPTWMPVVNEEKIMFNGIGGNGHETFYLPREMEGGLRNDKYRFNFCKTARKPYDIAVCAIMLSMHHHAPGAWDLASDGDIEEGSWQEALDLYLTTTGRELGRVEWLIP